MCLWILTACLGLIPANPPNNNVIVVQGVPTPIIQPTTIPTASPTFLPTAGTTIGPGNPIITVGPPIITVAPPVTVVPTVTVPPTVSTAPPIVTTSVPIVTSPGGVLLPIIACNNSDIICVANPDDIAGPLPIDPRLGSTPAPQSPPSAALQIPPIIGYSGQVETFEVPVKFPREKRSLNDETVHSIVKRQSCVCVPAGTCATSTNNNNYGAGQIDVRIVGGGGGVGGQCLPGQEYCCSGTTAQIACGTLQTTPPLAVASTAGQANFGEYPWQAMIVSRQNEYLAGGVLVDQRHVLTVTHRLSNYFVAGTAPNIKVRLGEWDAAVTTEPIPYQEYNVQRVFTHPSFNPSTLQYDITVLRLATTVPLTPAAGAATTINRACLPPSAASTYVGQRCWVSGWGKNQFGPQGQYQQILKEVDVPIVNSATCQSQMQAARLGPTFVLDTTSFICAGGEANKDSCTGDGGSGLVCSVNGQWVVVGLVAWGLGCANTNVPAAYVNIAALLPWIQQQIATP